jgi:hypothetical protein
MGNPVEELAALPGDDKPWYKQAHLRKLNFITLSMVLFCMSSKARSQAPS